MRSAFRWCLLLLAALAPQARSADDSTRVQALERRLEQSLRQIEALSRKLEQLEQRIAGSPEAQPTAARVEQLERRIDAVAAAAPHDGGLPVHGFADALAGYSAENNPHFGRGRKGFSVGTLDLYLTPNFGQVRALAEVVFEIEDSGESIVELERAQLGHVFSDALTLWLGRFHSPLGYWNTAYHHGAQLQTSILRPRFLDFEDLGGIIPAHGVGLWATGRLNAGGTELRYDAYLANAPSISGTAGDEAALDIRPAGGDDNHLATGFRLAWMPAAAPGLGIGAHGLRMRVDADSGRSSRVSMLGAFLSYDEGPWELIGEAYQFRNQALDAATPARESSAWFVQAGYRSGAMTPFARLERTDLDQRDPYFAEQRNGRSYQRLALGLRYELAPQAALKFEVDRTRKRDLPAADDRYDEARIQYAIRF